MWWLLFSMQIIRCKALGYCHGVKKTINNADSLLALACEKNVPSYSIGSLIHNEHVVSYYNDKGLKTISNYEGLEKGFALVRAHGISKTLKEQFTEKGFTLIDSTCINIISSLKKIDNAVEHNRTVIVLGIKDHAETKTLIGQASSINLISNIDDCKKCESSLDQTCPITVIVQTTFSQSEFEKLSKELRSYFSNIVFANNLCEVCIERKKMALDMAKKCDATIVVGSKESSNTKDLALFLKENGNKVFLISDKYYLDNEVLNEILSYNTIGVCSGTSTPIKVIDELCNYIEDEQIKRSGKNEFTK